MYKTILVHVDGTARSAQRVDAAAQLAIAYEAHLVGAAATGLSAFALPISVLEAGAVPIVFPIAELQGEADRVLDGFDARARQAGVHSFERRRCDEETGMAIAMQSRFCDLVVIGQAPTDESVPFLRSDLPEYVVMEAVSPVLVLPANGIPGKLGRIVTVAWNGSKEASHAIASAIPLLKRAEKVHLVVLAGDGDKDLYGDDPGADMALYLARHGVHVDLCVGDPGADAGAALLSFAQEKGSDLIVMGAFGHTRFREFLLGGATQTALRSSPLALWMAH